MLIWISITLVVLLTSYVIYYTFRNRDKLTSMPGMMISMTNSMMVSIAFGTILGTLIQNKDLTIPTIISVLIGMIVGYLTGRPISLMASLDGLGAGIMGGMMGSMLGVMLQPKSSEIMIYFIDVVYVLVIILLIRLIEEESKSDTIKPSTPKKKPLVANPIVLLVLLIFMGILVFGKGTVFSNTSEPGVKDVKFDTPSSQIYEVVVTPTAYTPNNLVVKSGTPFIINFKTGIVGCTGIILSEELGFNIALKENTNNYINIKSLKPGTYHYNCGMNMYKGTITVVK
ncbi:cupredoxin domain-containing protein [Peribacillus alkalitolerans]|uniref:cupredoxin domain-containing protein n=1 Tax=Peribacillus alkalitolerans TaxID=1550385 RepID=UPI0013D09598|nr:cupredoxin domain-containing protein [Peribacillus alkalitolerans]